MSCRQGSRSASDLLTSVHRSTTHPSAIPPTEFRPPSGFKAPKSQTTPSNAVSSALSNLRNKQIFHITAPSLLPLSKVKEVSLAKIMQGEPVLVHDGVSYGIPPEDLSQQDPNEKTLLLYETKAHTYFRAPTSDIQSYHVQEMVNIPRQLNSEPPNTSIVMNPPKLQPKHLKMRFRPVGSRNAPPETLGSSSESEREISTAKKSQGEERKRKHPHHEIDGSQPGAVSRKKSKKQPSSQEDGLSSSQFTTVPISPSTDERGRDKAKKPKKNREETSQERRARREEKKKKKADKVA